MYQASEKQLQKYKLRKDQVVLLCKPGCHRSEIAKELGLSLKTIDSTVKELIKEGRISFKPVRKFVSKMEHSVKNLNCERAQTIISLKKQGYTLKQIGVALGGLTRERIRQLVKCIKQEHGEEVFVPDELILTLSEVAKKLNLRVNFIWKLCRGGKIPFKRRGTSEIGGYLLTKEGIDALKKIIKIRLRITHRPCIICKRPFVRKLILGRLTCLRKECRYKLHLRYAQTSREKLFGKKPIIESLIDWQRKLYQRLQSHKLPENEQWLGISEAVKIAKLSKTQIWYLGKRCIITTRDHPTKNWRVNPVITYSASEIEIARQVYAKYAK